MNAKGGAKEGDQDKQKKIVCDGEGTGLPVKGAGEHEIVIYRKFI